MEITPINVTIADLTKNYKDDGDGGVYGYFNQLIIRPSFQREFVYKDKQRDMVIMSVMQDRPLNVMYWSKIGTNQYEVLDGQQRTISIAQYINHDFPIKLNGNDKFFQNLSLEEQDQILNYELTVYICEGTDSEKLEWFRTINIAGVTLTNQELLNATYTGTWLADAKNYFSKRNCVAAQMSENYLKGNPIRQDYLEKTLGWIANRDQLSSGQLYMAIHQQDLDANDLWLYFQSVINWAKMMFPISRRGMTDAQDWGLLYNQYHAKAYNSNQLEQEIQCLLLDDDVTRQSGIIPYVLSNQTDYDEKLLSLRTFSVAQKMRVYEAQHRHCKYCEKNGILHEYDFDELQGDHIIPWSQGGHTKDDNLQLLCQKCNNLKSDQ